MKGKKKLLVIFNANNFKKSNKLKNKSRESE